MAHPPGFGSDSPSIGEPNWGARAELLSALVDEQITFKTVFFPQLKLLIASLKELKWSLLSTELVSM